MLILISLWRQLRKRSTVSPLWQRRCLWLHGEERPTMKQVETELQTIYIYTYLLIKGLLLLTIIISSVFGLTVKLLSVWFISYVQRVREKRSKGVGERRSGGAHSPRRSPAGRRTSKGGETEGACDEAEVETGRRRRWREKKAERWQASRARR